MVQSKQVMEWQAQARSESELKTRVEDLLNFLEARFGPVSADLASAIATTQDKTVLKCWVRLAGQVNSLADFRQRAEL